MAQDIDKIFQEYLKDISLTMISEKSSYAKQNKVIEEQFLRYGLTNEQLAQIIAEINGKAMQFITQYSNASALELVKLNENRPLLEAQIELAHKDIELKEKELIIKDKDLELKDKDLALKDKELVLKESEIQIREKELIMMQAELDIKEQELLIKQEQLKEMYAKISLISNQAATEIRKALNIDADTKSKDQSVKVQKQEEMLKEEQVKTQVQETALKESQTSETSAKECLIRKQCETEEKQQGLIAIQTGLVSRQVVGYDDNRRVKKSEHLSNLAGFAVNAGADGMSGMVTAATHAANQI